MSDTIPTRDTIDIDREHFEKVVLGLIAMKGVLRSKSHNDPCASLARIEDHLNGIVNAFEHNVDDLWLDFEGRIHYSFRESRNPHVSS